MELSRLLRRVLLVAVVGVAGWLLGVLFAGTAGADELPEDGSQVYKGHSLLGSFLGGLTGTLEGVTDAVSGITDSLVDVPAHIVAPVVTPQPDVPVVTTPEVLPVDSSAGGAATDRFDVPRAETTIVTAAPDVPESEVPAPPAVVAPVAPEPAPATPVVSVPVVPVTPVQDLGVEPAEHAGQGDGPQQPPAKAPGAPAGSGTTASASHDSSGGARSTHGVLPAQDVLQPADAGFTTRSLAVDAAGRSAGLPTSSPD
jgi:hypothetical protein